MAQKQHLHPVQKKKLDMTGAICTDGGIPAVPAIFAKDFPNYAEPGRVYSMILKVSGAPDWKERKRFAATDAYGDAVVLVMEDDNRQWSECKRAFPHTVVAYGCVVQREGGGKEFEVLVDRQLKGRSLGRCGFTDLDSQFDLTAHRLTVEMTRRFPLLFGDAPKPSY